MNRVVGTAGHVDHGKTSLIRQLTGISPSRLPEERERGMTIDLGFAHFRAPGGERIGVIDVPGHERFIRNMVAGVWSLNAVLFVVAADEGWMPMSEDHLRIIKAMGIGQILLVLNKIDKVDGETRALALLEAQEHCQTILGRELPVSCVSAHTGEGIEELRSRTAALALKADFEAKGSPYLYIDRHFAPTGVGSIVTGSLVGGRLKGEDGLRLYPGGAPVRIKGIQSHYQKVGEADPVSRVALNIRVNSKGGIHRGMCLAAEELPLLCSKDLLVQVQLFLPLGEVKNHLEVELAAGTFHVRGVVHFLDKPRHYARILLEEEVPFLRYQSGVIIRHGGSTLIGSFSFVDSQGGNRSRRRRILALLAGREGAPLSQGDFDFQLEGYREAPGYKAKETDIYLNPWLITPEKWADLEETLRTFAQATPEGFGLQELPQKIAPLPGGLKKAVLAEMIRQRLLRQEGRVYLPRERAALSERAQRVINMAEEAGRAGLDSGTLDFPGVSKELRQLTRWGLLVHLEEKLFYSKRAYEEAKEKILAGWNPGASFSIGDAREATGLSRKYIVPLLNRMEDEKLLCRQGDRRVVLPVD